MFALPGSPVFWYGEEIGMGDDLSLDERNSVRTPMQWADEPNAGFSTAKPSALVRPVVSEGAFDYRRVNVADQRDQADSLLQLLERLVRIRRSCPEVGWGRCVALPTAETSVLALRYDWEGTTTVILHNMADRAVQCTLPPDFEHLRHLFSNQNDRKAHDGRSPIALDGLGFRWMRATGVRR
jgi:maltose alpha-D-glucosyltransferase / alpha-amylase